MNQCHQAKRAYPALLLTILLLLAAYVALATGPFTEGYYMENFASLLLGEFKP